MTYDEAVAMLPDGNSIHTFMNPNGMLLGADWSREEILAELRNAHEILETGPAAQAMGHGIAIDEDGRVLFIETRKSNVEEKQN